jgi:fibronectin type III domain protein
MPSKRTHPVRNMLRCVLGAAISVALLAPPGARAQSLLLSWTAPGDDGNVGRATTYELRYSETAVASDTVSWWGAAINVGALPAPRTAGSAESFTVAGLDSGTTYYFIIRTADEVPNWSGFSNVAVRTTGSSGGNLVTPTGFTAQNVAGGVRLNWNAVTTGTPPAGYHVYRRAGSSPIGTLVLTAPVSQTSWTDSTVTEGVTYEYSIATYSGPNESTPAVATITVPGTPPVTTSTEMIGYPNPAKGSVTFRFQAGTASGEPGHVRLVIYDLSGHKVCKLLDDVVPAGERTVAWPCLSDAGNAVAPGLYNAILDTPQGRQVTRLAIVP